MKIVEMIMPQMGESILECTVLALLKNAGETVETDESILEVATDKVDTEVPSMFSGVIKEWLVKVDDVIAIGSPVVRIEVDDATDAAEADEPATTPELAASLLEKEMEMIGEQVPVSGRTPVQGGKNNGFYSPLVLTIAREESVTQEELRLISGTGLDNRLTKDDLLSYIENRSEQSGVREIPTGIPTGEVEIIEMDRMRKMIARRMLESKQISPHVTAFAEADMTAVVQWRERVRNQFFAKTGEGITYTPVLVQATAQAIRKFPMINVSVEGDSIIVRKDINIGIAVALPSGNLIVPVIHQADQYNLADLTMKVNDLAKRARANRLTADDLANGTFSISNIGTFGNLMGTPIIVQPQVGILAFGAIQKKPAVIETEEGDFIGIRQKMFISHSFDHRVVDGALGGLFLKQVADNLEKFDTSISFE